MSEPTDGTVGADDRERGADEAERVAGATPDGTASDGKEIDDAIVALRAEIARLDTDDPEDRARLETLAERLRLRLERSEQGPIDDGAMEVLETLQARYPQVTLLINDITTRLASMGI